MRRTDLWRLAPNPLLLTVMALVHAHKGRLPDARAQLYEDCIDILLWRWEQIKVGASDETPKLRLLLGVAGLLPIDLKTTLSRLAFQAHESIIRSEEAGKETLAGISELDLEKNLAALHPDRSRDWAVNVIETIKLRAGLLLERSPEVYGFPHRTFQEYLAGTHLAADPAFAKRSAALAEEGALWHEVILLAVGKLVYQDGDTSKPLTLVAELCPVKARPSKKADRKTWLAGEVFCEIGKQRAGGTKLGAELLERVCNRLQRLLERGALSTVERAAAGIALGTQALKDAYGALKDKIIARFKGKSSVEAAAGQIEKKPESEDFREFLKTELENAGAGEAENSDLVEEAERFLELLKDAGIGTNQVIQTGDGAVAVGDHNIVAGKGGVAAGSNISASTIVTGDSRESLDKMLEEILTEKAPVLSEPD